MHYKKWSGFLLLVIIFIPGICNAKATGKTYTGVVKEIDSLRSITIGNKLSIWSVDATSAGLLRVDGTSMPFSEVQVGDQLSVRGRMVWTTINATQVIDLTRHAKKYTLNGQVSSVGKNSFKVDVANVENKIVYNADTSWSGVGKKSLKDVLVKGAKVKIVAVKNKEKNSYTATVVVIKKP